MLIHTDRLIIRRMEDRDVSNFLEYESTPITAATLPGALHGRTDERVHQDCPRAANWHGGAVPSLCDRVSIHGKDDRHGVRQGGQKVHRQGDIGWFLHPDYHPARAVYRTRQPMECIASIKQLVHTAAVELAPRSIRVNAVSPGPTETPIFDKLGVSTEQKQETKANVEQLSPWDASANPMKSPVSFFSWRVRNPLSCRDRNMQLMVVGRTDDMRGTVFSTLLLP